MSIISKVDSLLFVTSNVSRTDKSIESERREYIYRFHGKDKLFQNIRVNNNNNIFSETSLSDQD